MLRRRGFIGSALPVALGAAGASPLLAQGSADFAAALREGGCALLLRHAQTEAGVGDPPGFRVDMCSTQRNLSNEGRAQARRIGEWLSARGLRPAAVLSSAWCRCRDTADLAFGRHALWPALNSFFGTSEGGKEQAAQMRAALLRLPRQQFEAWVTHQVNVTALTGAFIGMGEAFVVDARGQVLARQPFGA